jgi:hypothetical protein
MNRERVARSPWKLLARLIVLALLFGAGRPSYAGEVVLLSWSSATVELFWIRPLPRRCRDSRSPACRSPAA